MLPSHRVRKFAPRGVISTFAGNGRAGFGGDGGPASQAQLNRPESIAVDVAGNVYIADTENFRVRRVATDGVITTIAGSGEITVGGWRPAWNRRGRRARPEEYSQR